MSLRHALLGVLSAQPMTGYDLVQFFDNSASYFWHAVQAQIYTELRHMETDGLLRAKVAPRGQFGEKRIYAITSSGESELVRWTTEVTPYPPERDVIRLKSTYLDVAPLPSARAHFEAHITHYSMRMQQWQTRIENLKSRRATLLVARLAKRPPHEHAAIIEFKVLGFEGQIARAKAEIAWAKKALNVVARLERQKRSAPTTPRNSRRGMTA